MSAFIKLVAFAAALGALLGANALPTSPPDYAIKERYVVPRAWTAIGAADKSKTINLQIGLKKRNEGLVERHLLEVSDPTHERYGQHLSASEIREMVSQCPISEFQRVHPGRIPASPASSSHKLVERTV
jgi:tripeptidyl-peptidase I